MFQTHHLPVEQEEHKVNLAFTWRPSSFWFRLTEFEIDNKLSIQRYEQVEDLGKTVRQVEQIDENSCKQYRKSQGKH